ncbi:mediator complex subunit 27-domain-containing protein [Halteromyces radiatus]|uniref:mediator complex subunit 27-domain-containing protein n=1 Tax=Halteromyces radiatus TaxID=101107 RepID=UPI00221F8205|nr:mediator complex subunit 27-domain-containing protein [Halteromyces radiatus]KAI8097527.1 mediator complex subunit 27-domain-containing protein [Halteromyces radiatus]
MMTATRTQQEIEQDVANIDRTLSTISETRSSLQHFIRTIKKNPNGPTYIHQFSEGLNKIKRDLNRQSVEVENLKVALEYAQQVAQVNAFDWPAIKEIMNKETTNNEGQVDTQVETKKETGNTVKTEVDRLYSELSSIVLEKHQTGSSKDHDNVPIDFITSHFSQWMNSNKHQHHHISGKFLEQEQSITTGSTCCLQISVHKVLTATMDLEYHYPSDSLIIHRYEIKGPKENKPFWKESKYNVFQKITLIAARAFEDMTLLSAREALLGLLDWLSSYHHLFTAPCHRCQKRLQYDSPQYKHLPPVIRTWVQRKNATDIPITSTTVTTPLSSPTKNEPTTDHQGITGLPYHIRCFNTTV